MSIITETPLAPVKDAVAPHPQPLSPEGTGGKGVPAARELRRKAARGGAALVASRIAAQAVAWAVTLVVARLLRPYDYGLMAAGMVFIGVSDLLAEAGIGKALIQKRRLRPREVGEGFTLSLLFALGLYALLFVLAPPAAAFLAMPDLGPFLRVLGLLVLLVPFRAIPLALLDRDLRLGSRSAAQAGAAVLQSALILTLAAAGMGYWSFAAGVLAAHAAEAIALAWLAGWVPRPRWPGRRARRLLAFGLHVSFASLLWFAYSNSDYAVAGKLAGPVALGFYALAFQLVTMPVRKLTATCNQVVYPVLCRLRDDPKRVRDWYLRLTVLLGFFGMPALVGMALVAEDAVGLLLGEKWLPAVLPFRLLSLAGIVMLLASSLPPLFNALGRPDINLKYAATCALLLPPAFAGLGALHGIVGVCIAWVAVFPAVVVGLVWLTRELTGVSPGNLLGAQLPVVAAVLLMTGAVLATQWSLRGVPEAWIRLASSVAVGVLAYAGCVFFLGRQTAIADLRRLLRDVRG